MTTRETVIAALFTRLSGAYAFKTKSRRLKLWDQVPIKERPALFVTEHGELWTRQNALASRQADVDVYVYIDAKDASKVGGSELNVILDAIEAALAPGPAEPGRQTLGGLAAQVFIEGDVFKDPGDLDGDGVMIVPVKVRLP